MGNAPISRRRFFKVAGLTLSGAALTVAGAGCAPAAQKAPKVKVETPSFAYGQENTQSKRILVAYATRTGSTVGVASAIGETLAKRGFAVDVKPINDKPALDGYQTVLIGSAINGAQWLPEALEFVKNNQPALSSAALLVFCVHIMNLGDDESSANNRHAYLNSVRALIKPVDEAYFAGIGMDPDEQSGFERWAYRTFKIGPEGDCRDWTKIRAWAEGANL